MPSLKHVRDQGFSFEVFDKDKDFNGLDCWFSPASLRPLWAITNHNLEYKFILWLLHRWSLLLWGQDFLWEYKDYFPLVRSHLSSIIGYTTVIHPYCSYILADWARLKSCAGSKEAVTPLGLWGVMRLMSLMDYFLFNYVDQSQVSRSIGGNPFFLKLKVSRFCVRTTFSQVYGSPWTFVCRGPWYISKEYINIRIVFMERYIKSSYYVGTAWW